MSEFTETEKACLAASCRPGGYVMYDMVQTRAALALKERGLVNIDFVGNDFGRVFATPPKREDKRPEQ